MSCQPCCLVRHLGLEPHQWKPFQGMCSGHSPPALIQDRMPHRSLHRSMQEAAALCNSRAQRRIRQAPSHADVIRQPRTPSAEATINPGCSGMCSGHSPPAAVYQMLYRSLHRSAQEAAAPRNSRAPRRIRRAANPFRYDNPARNPIGRSQLQSQARVVDIHHPRAGCHAGSYGAAQLQGACSGASSEHLN